MNGTSLVIQWFRFHISNTEGMGSIPCQENKIPHATCYGQNIRLKKYKKKQAGTFGMSLILYNLCLASASIVHVSFLSLHSALCLFWLQPVPGREEECRYHWILIFLYDDSSRANKETVACPLAANWIFRKAIVWQPLWNAVFLYLQFCVLFLSMVFKWER